VTTTQANLRKAAVLIRSLDSDTAAIMLGQLSPDEATSIRAAIRALGPMDAEEQADVVAEFRRTRPAMGSAASSGVELELSSHLGHDEPSIPANFVHKSASAERFQFLASASTSVVVRFLAREHSQTIAVVLSHLAPARAAAVLAELPDKLQAETIERLAVLGETDPESVTVLERELAAWIATRGDDRGTVARRRETVTNILAAADEKTRRGILGKLKTHNRALAEEIAPERKPEANAERSNSSINELRRRLSPLQRQGNAPQPPAPSPQPPAAPALPRIAFDQLILLDNATLTTLLRSVDANVLAIALAGSREELVDRICSQMPKATARAFRRELQRLGPTRLSDVEAAQRAIADAAARHLVQRRQAMTAAHA
jgi:flagellar motor switch protein FliG